MLESQEMLQALYQEKTTLKKLIRDLQGRSKAKAETERIYRIAKAAQIKIERENGTAVTLITDLVAGNEQIAQLKADRDIADMMYDACKQAIYATKTEIQILTDLIKLEYNTTE